MTRSGGDTAAELHCTPRVVLASRAPFQKPDRRCRLPALMLGVIGLGLISGVLSACSAAETAPVASNRGPSRPAGTRAAPRSIPSASATANSADLVVAEALAMVARVRELPALGPVHGRLVTRQQMLDVVRDEVVAEVPPKAVEAQEQLLVGLGVVPLDFDYMSSVLALMGQELAGMYEPKSKTMLLSSDLGRTERWAALSHELVHALQDQHYDLAERVAHRSGGGDEQSVTQTLAEGDATSAMLDVLRGKGSKQLDRGLSWERGLFELGGPANVPAILRRSLIAPYVDGMVLVERLRQRGGWAAVDELWRLPPRSTEQLLHPEKLASREAPVVVAVPEAPDDSGWVLVDADVLGEQSVRLTLEEWVPRRTASASAADWGGDRMAVYQRGGEYAGVWHVAYDSAVAAERGLWAFARGVLKLEEPNGEPTGPADSVTPVPESEAKAKTQGGELCRNRALRGPFAVVRRGRSVMVALGPFRRAGAVATPSGDCGAALAWAHRALNRVSGEAPVPHP